MHKLVKIKFQNGLNKADACKDILNELTDDFIFEESDQPDFILFGPYGNDIPKPGDYTRIGYFCENIKPDLSICEWAFGIPYEEDVNDSRYKKIQWHDLDPKSLIKPDDYDPHKIFEGKEKFCAFIYGNKVPYREEFFKQLSSYKKVDAPGISMNNMPNAFDTQFKGSIWERKRQFLSKYKFTISFENYVYPGYQTEKLYDAMLANSIPIYCGDKHVSRVFNTKSFINVPSLMSLNNPATVKFLEKHSQQDFKDIRPSYYHSPFDRIKRKLKAMGREAKMIRQFKRYDFKPVIEKIIELDQDKSKYLQMLKQPWLNNNVPPENASLKNRWIEIFEQPVKQNKSNG
jgi:hypothetical protein